MRDKKKFSVPKISLIWCLIIYWSQMQYKKNHEALTVKRRGGVNLIIICLPFYYPTAWKLFWKVKRKRMKLNLTKKFQRRRILVCSEWDMAQNSPLVPNPVSASQSQSQSCKCIPIPILWVNPNPNPVSPSKTQSFERIPIPIPWVHFFKHNFIFIGLNCIGLKTVD